MNSYTEYKIEEIIFMIAKLPVGSKINVPTEFVETIKIIQECGFNKDDGKVRSIIDNDGQQICVGCGQKDLINRPAGVCCDCYLCFSDEEDSEDEEEEETNKNINCFYCDEEKECRNRCGLVPICDECN